MASLDKPKYVKISFYIKRREDCSEEKFHDYWKNNHAKLAMENPTFKKNARRYNQLHNSPELKEQAAKFGLPILDFDGVGEIWVDSLEDWKEIVSDKKFTLPILADEDNFAQPPHSIMLGYDNLIFDQEK